MCTVSIVSTSDGVRLVCNRDELRTRPEAHDPVMRRVGLYTAVFPIDPISGGTWIAANDAALAMALLNRNEPRLQPASTPRSRGVIIPGLIGCGELNDVVGEAMRIDVGRFHPFRLVVVQHSRVADIVSDGVALSWRCLPIDLPLMFTSSSLGDAVVEQPRRELFQRLVYSGSADAWRDAQRRFHRHHWRSRPEVSVVMTRPDARTVSRTTIDLARGEVSLRYRPVPAVH